MSVKAYNSGFGRRDLCCGSHGPHKTGDLSKTRYGAGNQLNNGCRAAAAGGPAAPGSLISDPTVAGRRAVAPGTVARDGRWALRPLRHETGPRRA